jgi:hypothetical protein
LFDSKIIKYILSEEFKVIFGSWNGKCRLNENAIARYYQVMAHIKEEYNLNDSYIPMPEAFANLEVKLVPQDTLFRITEYDGAEKVEIFDIANYIRA